jgi:hypothetical protein
MSEKPQTPESVALALSISIEFGMDNSLNKKEKLDLYAECLQATKGNRVFNS